jgi:hypothetical protein
MTAEAVQPNRSIDLRKLAIGVVTTAAILLVAASCEDGNGGSPIDTTGVPGSGYTPPRRDHYPEGMDMPGASIGDVLPCHLT